jgi:ankyrin repeat protein
LLLDRRVRRSCPTSSGDTPLISAARAGQQDSVRLLLDRKVAKVNESTSARVAMLGNGHGPSVPGIVGGQTALMAAAQANRAAVVSELLARGASLSKKDHQGRTALDYADTAYGNEAAVVIRNYMDRG